MTPLQRAQKHNRDFAETHKEIVDSLRKSGFSREDAVKQADVIEGRLLDEKERDIE